MQQLAAAFDEMAGSLEQRVAERQRAEARLKALNEDLEKRIADRTRELERSNQELEEFAYAASGNGFTCDGTQLPNVGRLDWMPADTLRQNGYAVHLECNGRRFRIIVDPPNGKPSYALEPNGRISVP